MKTGDESQKGEFNDCDDCDDCDVVRVKEHKRSAACQNAAATSTALRQYVRSVVAIG